MERKLGVMEERLAQLIWDHAPLPSGQLVALCSDAFQWKKSTTYTMLRRLCQQSLFENQDGQVRPLMSREDFLALQSQDFVKETFGGSLPHFLAAFTSRTKLSSEEIESLEQMIRQWKE